MGGSVFNFAPVDINTHTHTGGEQLKETHRCDNSMRKIIIYALADDEICLFLHVLPPDTTDLFISFKKSQM
jgi:hypothetical protein